MEQNRRVLTPDERLRHALAFLGANHQEADRLIATEFHRDQLCLCAAILLTGLLSSSRCIRRGGKPENEVRDKVIAQLAPLFEADFATVLIEWAQVQPTARDEIAPCSNTVCDVPWVNSPARQAELRAERLATPPIEDCSSLGLGSSLASAVAEGEDPEERRKQTIRAWQRRKRESGHKPVDGM